MIVFTMDVPIVLHEELYRERLPNSVDADGAQGRGACLQNSIDLLRYLVDKEGIPENRVAILYATNVGYTDMVTNSEPLREVELPPDFDHSEGEVPMRHHGMTVVFDRNGEPRVYDQMCKREYWGQPLDVHLSMLFETDTAQNVHIFRLSYEDAQTLQNVEMDIRDVAEMAALSEELAVAESRNTDENYYYLEDFPDGVCDLFAEGLVEVF